MTTLSTELPEKIFATLRQSLPKVVIDGYRRSLVSQGRGAEIAGLARADVVDALARRKTEVDHIDLDKRDGEIGEDRGSYLGQGQ